jgi:hypothetical protein
MEVNNSDDKGEDVTAKVAEIVRIQATNTKLLEEIGVTFDKISQMINACNELINSVPSLEPMAEIERASNEDGQSSEEEADE